MSVTNTLGRALREGYDASSTVQLLLYEARYKTPSEEIPGALGIHPRRLDPKTAPEAVIYADYSPKKKKYLKRVLQGLGIAGAVVGTVAAGMYLSQKASRGLQKKIDMADANPSATTQSKAVLAYLEAKNPNMGPDERRTIQQNLDSNKRYRETLFGYAKDQTRDAMRHHKEQAALGAAPEQKLLAAAPETPEVGGKEAVAASVPATPTVVKKAAVQQPKARSARVTLDPSIPMDQAVQRALAGEAVKYQSPEKQKQLRTEIAKAYRLRSKSIDLVPKGNGPTPAEIAQQARIATPLLVRPATIARKIKDVEAEIDLYTEPHKDSRGKNTNEVQSIKGSKHKDPKAKAKIAELQATLAKLRTQQADAYLTRDPSTTPSRAGKIPIPTDASTSLERDRSEIPVGDPRANLKSRLRHIRRQAQRAGFGKPVALAASPRSVEPGSKLVAKYPLPNPGASLDQKMEDPIWKAKYDAVFKELRKDVANGVDSNDPDLIQDLTAKFPKDVVLAAMASVQRAEKDRNAILSQSTADKARVLNINKRQEVLDAEIVSQLRGDDDEEEGEKMPSNPDVLNKQEKELRARLVGGSTKVGDTGLVGKRERLEALLASSNSDLERKAISQELASVKREEAKTRQLLRANQKALKKTREIELPSSRESLEKQEKELRKSLLGDPENPGLTVQKKKLEASIAKLKAEVDSKKGSPAHRRALINRLARVTDNYDEVSAEENRIRATLDANQQKLKKMNYALVTSDPSIVDMSVVGQKPKSLDQKLIKKKDLDATKQDLLSRLKSEIAELKLPQVSDEIPDKGDSLVKAFGFPKGTKPTAAQIADFIEKGMVGDGYSSAADKKISDAMANWVMAHEKRTTVDNKRLPELAKTLSQIRIHKDYLVKELMSQDPGDQVDPLEIRGEGSKKFHVMGDSAVPPPEAKLRGDEEEDLLEKVSSTDLLRLEKKAKTLAYLLKNPTKTADDYAADVNRVRMHEKEAPTTPNSKSELAAAQKRLNGVDSLVEVAHKTSKAAFKHALYDYHERLAAGDDPISALSRLATRWKTEEEKLAEYEKSADPKVKGHATRTAKRNPAIDSIYGIPLASDMRVTSLRPSDAAIERTFGKKASELNDEEKSIVDSVSTIATRDTSDLEDFQDSDRKEFINLTKISIKLALRNNDGKKAEPVSPTFLKTFNERREQLGLPPLPFSDTHTPTYGEIADYVEDASSQSRVTSAQYEGPNRNIIWPFLRKFDSLSRYRKGQEENVVTAGVISKANQFLKEMNQPLLPETGVTRKKLRDTFDEIKKQGLTSPVLDMDPEPFRKWMVNPNGLNINGQHKDDEPVSSHNLEVFNRYASWLELPQVTALPGQKVTYGDLKKTAKVVNDWRFWRPKPSGRDTERLLNVGAKNGELSPAARLYREMTSSLDGIGTITARQGSKVIQGPPADVLHTSIMARETEEAKTINANRDNVNGALAKLDLVDSRQRMRIAKATNRIAQLSKKIQDPKLDPEKRRKAEEGIEISKMVIVSANKVLETLPQHRSRMPEEALKFLNEVQTKNKERMLSGPQIAQLNEILKKNEAPLLRASIPWPEEIRQALHDAALEDADNPEQLKKLRPLLQPMQKIETGQTIASQDARRLGVWTAIVDPPMVPRENIQKLNEAVKKHNEKMRETYGDQVIEIPKFSLPKKGEEGRPLDSLIDEYRTNALRALGDRPFMSFDEAKLRFGLAKTEQLKRSLENAQNNSNTSAWFETYKKEVEPAVVELNHAQNEVSRARDRWDAAHKIAIGQRWLFSQPPEVRNELWRTMSGTSKQIERSNVDKLSAVMVIPHLDLLGNTGEGITEAKTLAATWHQLGDAVEKAAKAAPKLTIPESVQHYLSYIDDAKPGRKLGVKEVGEINKRLAKAGEPQIQIPEGKKEIRFQDVHQQFERAKLVKMFSDTSKEKIAKVPHEEVKKHLESPEEAKRVKKYQDAMRNLTAPPEANFYGNFLHGEEYALGGIQDPDVPIEMFRFIPPEMERELHGTEKPTYLKTSQISRGFSSGGKVSSGIADPTVKAVARLEKELKAAKELQKSMGAERTSPTSETAMSQLRRILDLHPEDTSFGRDPTNFISEADKDKINPIFEKVGLQAPKTYGDVYHVMDNIHHLPEQIEMRIERLKSGRRVNPIIGERMHLARDTQNLFRPWEVISSSSHWSTQDQSGGTGYEPWNQNSQSGAKKRNLADVVAARLEALYGEQNWRPLTAEIGFGLPVKDKKQQVLPRFAINLPTNRGPKEELPAGQLAARTGDTHKEHPAEVQRILTDSKYWKKTPSGDPNHGPVWTMTAEGRQALWNALGKKVSLPDRLSGRGESALLFTQEVAPDASIEDPHGGHFDMGGSGVNESVVNSILEAARSRSFAPRRPVSTQSMRVGSTLVTKQPSRI